MRIFEIHAEYCRTLANPKRLAILTVLDGREMSVGDLADCLDAPIAAISQNLKVLRDRHLVHSRREAQKVYYTVADRRLVAACRVIRAVLIDGMKVHGEVAENFDPENLFKEDEHPVG